MVLVLTWFIRSCSMSSMRLSSGGYAYDSGMSSMRSLFASLSASILSVLGPDCASLSRRGFGYLVWDVVPLQRQLRLEAVVSRGLEDGGAAIVFGCGVLGERAGGALLLGYLVRPSMLPSSSMMHATHVRSPMSMPMNVLKLLILLSPPLVGTPLEGDRSAMHTLAVGGQPKHDRQEVTGEYGLEGPHRTPDSQPTGHLCRHARAERAHRVLPQDAQERVRLAARVCRHPQLMKM